MKTTKDNLPQAKKSTKHEKRTTPQAKQSTFESKQSKFPMMKQDSVELSVIIPAYNLEKEIGRCLKSILSQKISAMEVIVVDDGSKDKTVDVVQKYAKKDSRVVFIRQPENRGVAAARNAGLKVAKGKYIHFCDGDDAVPMGAYQEMLSLASEKKADLVTGNYSRMYPEEGGVVRQFSHYSATIPKEQCFEAGNTMLWNRIYLRELIEKHHLRFNESLKYYEDFLFFNSFMLADPVVASTDMSVYIYTEPISRSTQKNIRYANLDCAIGLDKAWRTLLSAEIDEKDEDLWFQAYRWNLSWYYNYSWKMIQDMEVRRETYDILRSLVKWVEANVEFCSWQPEPFASEFRNLFRVDYATLCSLPFEKYLMILALEERFQPHAPNFPKEFQTKMTLDERDALLIKCAWEQVADLKEVYGNGKKRNNHNFWRDNYWTLVDSLMNDYWRPIVDNGEKERLFYAIKDMIETNRKSNAACCIPDPGILWHFKHIFCMDNSTLQTLSFGQYLMVSAMCLYGYAVPENSAPSPQGEAPAPVAYAPEPISYFITACENGQVGMSAIMRSAKAWMRFKIRRNR